MAASSPSGPAGALAAELSFLSLLLARNRPQHRRCIYFKRLSLALKAVRQLPSADEVAAAVKEWREHVQALLEEDGGESQNRKRRREEEQWTLDGEGGAEGGTPHEDSLRRTLQQMAPLLQQLRGLVTADIPAVVSRILHAAAPVLHELGRGYFVPFLTACLACLGRMRELLMRTARMVGEALRETVPRVRDFLRKTHETIGKSEWGAEGGWRALEDLVMPAFSAPASPSDMPNDVAPDDEWNVLMAQFVDVGHDELTRRVNEFARERRWERAAERWGLKGAASNPSDLTELQTAELECSENRGRGNYGECDDDELASQSIDRESGNDTGELVGDGRVSDATDEGHEADANLARILQRSNERRRGWSAASASDSFTKKNRKRERGGASDRTGESSAGATSEDECSAAPRQDRRAKPRGKELDGAGSRDVAKKKRTTKKKSKKVKRQKQKASNVIDDIFGS
ncbi:hypothetical protein ACHAXT_005815 [Thalassiosira profunda]